MEVYIDMIEMDAFVFLNRKSSMWYHKNLYENIKNEINDKL